MAAYIIASLYYLGRTHFVGTPFKDSLSAAQKKIKQASAEVRRNIFLEGLACSVIFLGLLQPFNKCS